MVSIEKVTIGYMLLIGNKAADLYASADAALDAALDAGYTLDEIVNVD